MSAAANTDIQMLLRIVRRQVLIRARDLGRFEIDRQMLSRALARGLIERRGRGLYALSRAEPPHAFAEACKRIPGGVICLFSALHFYGLTAEEPSEVWMAIDRKARLPRVDWLPLKFVRFSGKALTQGVENLKLGGVPIRVYSPMKTVADCYKYRGKIGSEVGRAALRASRARGTFSRYRLLRFARICRVEKIIKISLAEKLSPQSVSAAWLL